MEIISNNTRFLKFKRVDVNNDVITTIPKEMFLTVKKHVNSEKVVFQKTLEDFFKDPQNDEYWIIEIKPEDTADLPFGTYYFDIKVVENRYVQTIYRGELEVNWTTTLKKDENIMKDRKEV